LDYGDGKLKDIPQAQWGGQAVEIIRAFRPHVVFTFDETGAYGHRDPIAICHATTLACQAAGDPDQFPEHLQVGLLPHAPVRLCHYYPCTGR
jgi:LmbE family N-acetylglucosaminyl deacetylase